MFAADVPLDPVALYLLFYDLVIIVEDPPPLRLTYLVFGSLPVAGADYLYSNLISS